MKKAFAFLLIFAAISVLFGQDFDYHIESINKDYDINIEGNIIEALSNFFGCEITVREDKKD